MVQRGARVLDVGCGDGELLRLLESRGVDGRGIELSREGVNECVAKGLAVVQGDADTDLELSGRRLRLRHPVADFAGDAPAAARCSSICCASAATASCRSRISAIGASACRYSSAAICRARKTCPIPGTTPRTSISAASRIFANCPCAVGAKMEQAVALNPWGGRMRLKMPWWFWNLFGGTGGVLAQPAKLIRCSAERTEYNVRHLPAESGP